MLGLRFYCIRAHCRSRFQTGRRSKNRHPSKPSSRRAVRSGGALAGSGLPRLLQQAVAIDETAVLQRPPPAVRRRRPARLESEASAVTRNGVGTPPSLSGRRSATPTPPTPLRAAAPGAGRGEGGRGGWGEIAVKLSLSCH